MIYKPFQTELSRGVKQRTMFFHYDNLCWSRDGWFKCAVNIQVIFDREKFSLGPGLLACTGETNEKALWNFKASRRALKSIRYLWFYLALLNDSNAEIVQIYWKSVLPKFLRCAVSIHLIFDREKSLLSAPVSERKWTQFSITVFVDVANCCVDQTARQYTI